MNRIKFWILGLFFFLTNATLCTIWILGLMHCYNHTTSYNSTTNKDALLGEKDSRVFKDWEELSLPSPPLTPCASIHPLTRSADRKRRLILKNFTASSEYDRVYYHGPSALSTLLRPRYLSWRTPLSYTCSSLAAETTRTIMFHFIRAIPREGNTTLGQV